MTDRKKPGVAFWVTVVVVELVLYVASFGPACWLSDRHLLPYGAADAIYRPLVSLSIDVDCDEALLWYGTRIEAPADALGHRGYTAVGIEMNAILRSSYFQDPAKTPVSHRFD